MKKIIYIAGPITGVPRYWEAFEKAEDEILEVGCIPLSPSHLPSDLPNDKAMKICLSMIDISDGVLFLPGSTRSRGATLENQYCQYISKPWARDLKTLKEVLENDIRLQQCSDS